eukprot:SAG31_NODE_13138_length_890_cov_1.945638_1_plen_33_part_10
MPFNTAEGHLDSIRKVAMEKAEKRSWRLMLKLK